MKTIDDLRAKLTELEKKFRKEAALLQNEFALANSPVQIGDIAIDHIGSIKVDNIQVATTNDYRNGAPQCVYGGIELKKDLTPTKKGGRRQVWQCNLI